MGKQYRRLGSSVERSSSDKADGLGQRLKRLASLAFTEGLTLRPSESHWRTPILVRVRLVTPRRDRVSHLLNGGRGCRRLYPVCGAAFRKLRRNGAWIPRAMRSGRRVK